jgi:glycosyltransferase involved in cell wall biosynthesis
LAKFSPDDHQRRQARSTLGVADSDILIGMFARFVPGKKDHRSFIQAAGILSQRRPNVRFLLCGQGNSLDNPEIRSWVQKAEIGSRIILLGEQTDVASLVKTLDIGVLLSFFEGFPNVLGEMMGTAVPCVASDVGDCRRILGPHGRIVKPGDVDGVVKAWTELVDLGETQRGELGRLSREFVLKNYSLPSVSRKFESLHEELLESTGGSASYWERIPDNRSMK